MPILYRAGLGRALTHAELDANLRFLADAVAALQDGVGSGGGTTPGGLSYLRQDNTGNKTMTVSVPAGDTASQYEASLGTGILFRPLVRPVLNGTELTFNVGNRTLGPGAVTVRKIGSTDTVSNASGYTYVQPTYVGGLVGFASLGDSRTVGYPDQSPPWQRLQTVLGTTSFSPFAAFGGSGLGPAQILALTPTVWDGWDGVSTNRIVWSMYGVNAFYNPDVQETLEAAQAEIAASNCALVAAGFLVIASTETLVGAGNSWKNKADALDVYIRNNYQSWGCLGFTDLASDYRLQNTGNEVDGVHWGPNTNAVVTEMIAGETNRLMALIGGPKGDNLTNSFAASPQVSASKLYVSTAVTLSSAVRAGLNRTITKVEFFSGATSLGISPSTSSPYLLSWTPATAGSKTLTAKTTDNTGAVATSLATQVNVDEAVVPLQPLYFQDGPGYTHNENSATGSGGLNSGIAQPVLAFGPTPTNGADLRGIIEFTISAGIDGDISGFRYDAPVDHYDRQRQGLATFSSQLADWYGGIQGTPPTVSTASKPVSIRIEIRRSGNKIFYKLPGQTAFSLFGTQGADVVNDQTTFYWGYNFGGAGNTITNVLYFAANPVNL